MSRTETTRRDTLGGNLYTPEITRIVGRAYLIIAIDFLNFASRRAGRCVDRLHRQRGTYLFPRVTQRDYNNL